MLIFHNSTFYVHEIKKGIDGSKKDSESRACFSSRRESELSGERQDLFF